MAVACEHEGGKSAFSISHREDKKIMLNYLSVRAVFDREKRDVLKSLCYIFPFPVREMVNRQRSRDIPL